MKNFNQEGSELIRRAIAAQVIAPRKSWGLTKTDRRAIAFCWANQRPSINLDWAHPLENPKTLRTHESTYPIFIDTPQPDPTEYSLIEVARIAVPFRHVGYLKRIETFFADVNSNFFPTSSEFWGIPHHGISDVDNIRWYLRTEHFWGVQPARFALGSAVIFNVEAALPGQAYTELPEITGLWYPPHAGCSRVDMLIPEGVLLRMFFYSPPTPTFTWHVSGRLRAHIQSSENREAAYHERVRY